MAPNKFHGRFILMPSGLPESLHMDPEGLSLGLYGNCVRDSDAQKLWNVTLPDTRLPPLLSHRKLADPGLLDA